MNENQKQLEFSSHRFMIDIYADNSPDLVCIKSAQVGFSVYAILKSLHELQYERRNILYALPTREIVQSFVVPKVNPLISSNPRIAQTVGADAVALKKVGDRFIYFKGGFSEREAISISVDTLVVDEYDRMPDMQIVNMFDSRLQASDQPRRRRFSNPSGIGFGVDSLFQDSDQRYWFVKCEACGHDWFVDFEPSDDKRHHIDRELGQFVCGACRAVLTDVTRRRGRWVAKFPQRERHGYWISQMIAPWVTAKRILEQHDEMDTATFHSFVLGKAWTPSDMVVDREAILRACAPSLIPKTSVVIGVDQNASEQIYVMGTPQGIFAHGKTKAWEDIERLKLMYDAVVVSDPNPYPTWPKRMAQKYRDWFLCYFNGSNGTKQFNILDWKGQVVLADRTRLIDVVATEITEAKLLFRERAYALEDYIADWANLYRTTTEEQDGRTKSEWLKKEGKESDFSLATAYYRVGLTRVLNRMDAEMIQPVAMTGGTKTVTIGPNGESDMSLLDNVNDTMDQFE